MTSPAEEHEAGGAAGPAPGPVRPPAPSEREARLADIFARAAVGLSELAPDGRFVRVNEEMCRIAGRTREELLSRTFREVTHPDDAAAGLAAVATAVRTGTPATLDERYVRPGGEVIWANTTITPLPPAADGTANVLAVTVDLTERRHAQQALSDSEARYRLIVEGARDYAIFTIDGDGRIESWSPGAEAVFGWTPAEAVGRPMAVTFTPEDVAAGQPRQELEEARARGWAPDVRWHLRSDGTRVFIDGVTRALAGPQGEPTRFLKIGQDVTERRAMEDALRELNHRLEQRVAERTAELERAVAALRDEARQRAGAERARAEALRQLVTAEDAERRRISRELHDSLGQLVTGLLLGLRALETAPGDVARIRDLGVLADRVAREMQHMAVQLRPPALDSLGLAPALRDHLEEWSERNGIACDFHEGGLDGGRLPPEVETTVYRVVQEALNNVLKHAGARHVGLVLERRRGMLSAILEDDGVGFDVEATLATPGKARRLGVRGMRERVALLGGELVIESSPGAGTTLYVRLPVAPSGGTHHDEGEER